MKKNIWIIVAIVAIVLIGGGIWTYNKYSVKSDDGFVPPSFTPTPISSKKIDFAFNLVGSVLEVREKGTNNLVQKISISDETILKTWQGDYVNFENDINFDGYNDLLLLVSIGATNTFYDYFIYNPSINKFVKDSVLKGLSSPHFDANHKTISTQNAMGCAGNDSFEQMFSFQNGKYILSSEIINKCCFSNKESPDSTNFVEVKNKFRKHCPWSQKISFGVYKNEKTGVYFKYPNVLNFSEDIPINLTNWSLIFCVGEPSGSGVDFMMSTESGTKESVVKEIIEDFSVANIQNLKQESKKINNMQGILLTFLGPGPVGIREGFHSEYFVTEANNVVYVFWNFGFSNPPHDDSLCDNSSSEDKEQWCKMNEEFLQSIRIDPI